MSAANKQPPLHWPGWIWVILRFITGGWGIFAFLLAVYNTQFRFPGMGLYPGVPTYRVVTALVFSLLDIAAGIVMLCKRKAGWFMAIIMLAASMAYDLFLVVKDYPFTTYTPDDWLGILGTLIKLFWLIYFVLARKRYDIKSLHDPGEKGS